MQQHNFLGENIFTPARSSSGYLQKNNLNSWLSKNLTSVILNYKIYNIYVIHIYKLCITEGLTLENSN